MKKILCFILAILLTFNCIVCNYTVYAEDFSGTSTDYTKPSGTELKDLPESAPTATETFLKNVYFRPLTDFMESIGMGWDSWGNAWNDDVSKFVVDNVTKDSNVTTDGNYYYFNANFINQINKKVQDNVYRLNGYYLIEPTCSITPRDVASYYSGITGESFSDKYLSSSGYGYLILEDSPFALYHNSTHVYSVYYDSLFYKQFSYFYLDSDGYVSCSKGDSTGPRIIVSSCTFKDDSNPSPSGNYNSQY